MKPESHMELIQHRRRRGLESEIVVVRPNNFRSI